MSRKRSPKKPDTTTHARRTARLLAGLCAGMGALHFIKPEPFDGIIPPELPGEPRAWTYGSGVAELATAGLLAVPRTRRLGGHAAVALFIGVFPGNLEMARQWRHRHVGWQLISLGRLPLQALLIKQAREVARHG
ncbi:DoxX family protein [Corynebacterium sp. 335C]